MAYYMTYGEFQAHMKAYYYRTGKRLQFPEMGKFLYNQGLAKDSIKSFDREEVYTDYASMTDAEFDKIVDSLPLILSIDDTFSVAPIVQEEDLIPNARDVFVLRHPRYTRPSMHKHNYFEINFVACGQGKFLFEDETHVMKEGEICIIAPNSNHDFLIDDDSTVFTICIRKSTFDTTFFSLMTRKDLLSYFFQNILRGDDQANYLLFFTNNSPQLKLYIRHLMIESSRKDIYSNACSISLVNLLFAVLLRTASQTIQFRNCEKWSDVTSVLQYIQHNYQTLTLSGLADMFHYSEPHLCTLIKQNTGLTFTQLIKKLRLAEAVDLLLNTSMKVGEIADRVGYNSADHFSRVFRSAYDMSPQEYRKVHKDDDTPFIPLATN